MELKKKKKYSTLIGLMDVWLFMTHNLRGFDKKQSLSSPNCLQLLVLITLNLIAWSG